MRRLFVALLLVPGLLGWLPLTAADAASPEPCASPTATPSASPAVPNAQTAGPSPSPCRSPASLSVGASAAPTAAGKPLGDVAQSEVIDGLMHVLALALRAVVAVLVLVVGGINVFRMVVFGLWSHDSAAWRQGRDRLVRTLFTALVLGLMANGLDEGWLRRSVEGAAQQITSDIPSDPMRPSATPTPAPSP